MNPANSTTTLHVRRFIPAPRARVFAALGRAELRHLTAPREVRAMLATCRLEEWDDDFIASVARDGVLLWARSQPPDLPPSLASVAQRLVSNPR